MQNNKRRGRLEVVFSILSIIKDNRNSIKPTPLLRKSNLSSARFNEYLSELVEKGFVRIIEDRNGKLLTLTDKGFKYLERYGTIVSFIDDFGL